jgi:hypothetical protein
MSAVVAIGGSELCWSDERCYIWRGQLTSQKVAWYNIGCDSDRKLFRSKQRAREELGRQWLVYRNSYETQASDKPTR